MKILDHFSLIRYQTLSSDHLFEVFHLYNLCSQTDHFPYDQFIDPDEDTSSFYYLCQEDASKTLAGVLSFLEEDPLNKTYTVFGYIHPDYRRRHLFTEIMKNALSYAKKERITLLECLLCDAPERPAFLDSLLSHGYFQFYSREYHMVYDFDTLNPSDLMTKPIVHDDLASDDSAVDVSAPDVSALSVIYDEPTRKFLLFLGEEPIGSACIYLPSGVATPENCERVFFHSYEISENFRGRGYGRLSFIHMLQWLKNCHCHKLFLHVSGNNIIAHSLYESCGLNTDSSVSVYHNMPNQCNI